MEIEAPSRGRLCERGFGESRSVGRVIEDVERAPYLVVSVKLAGANALDGVIGESDARQTSVVESVAALIEEKNEVLEVRRACARGQVGVIRRPNAEEEGPFPVRWGAGLLRVNELAVC